MPCEEFYAFKSFPSSKREEIIQEGIDLKSRINAYFNDNEEQCTSPQYISLFPQLARQARHAMNALATTSTSFASTPAL
jgi:hypothetical protein